jgi:hypothetical protein
MPRSVFLATWLDANKHVATSFPANILSRRVGEVLSDGLITDDEKSRLLADLKTIASTGLTESVPALPRAHCGPRLPVRRSSRIPNKLFVLTGEFVFGSRPTCERAIMKRGGSVGSSVSGRTNYVVVGGMSTPAWIEQNYPRKDRPGRRSRQVGQRENKRNPRNRLGRLAPVAEG